jgi:putative ABC transport system permease protein
VIYPATQGERVTQMLAVYQLGLDFFAVIAIFVGAFLIYNAFSMTVVERTREIGMLRTIGMTRRQVMSQILAEATILGVVGAVLGIGAGVLLAQGLIRGMELLLAQEVRDVRIPLDGLITGVVIGIGVTLAAATIPAFQASRISPLEALRVRGITREGWLVRKGWPIGVALLVLSYLSLFRSSFLPPMVQLHLGRIAVFTLFLGATLVIPATISYWERGARPFLQRIYGSEGRLGSSNIQRAKMRTALTVAALMVGAAMILGIRGMTNAFERDIQSWIDVYVGGDLYVFGSLPMRVDLAKRIEAIEGVASVAPMRYVDIQRIDEEGNKENLVYTAIDPASYTRVTSFVFASNQGDPTDLLNRLAEGDAVFISSVLSEKHGLEQGDTIRLETRRGQRDFEIAAVVVDFYNQGQVVEGSWKDMRRYYGLNDVSAFLLKTQPGYDPEDVKTRIDELYGRSRHLTVESNRAMKERALTVTAQAFSLFDVLALIAMIVAALGVVNTLTMSVLERTRELGMLRSLGMTRRQVGKMILAEAIMMGLIGGAFGILFGLFLLRVILMATNSMQGYELTYSVPTQAVIISLIIALVVSQLAALWPARRAARIRILDAIQFE